MKKDIYQRFCEKFILMDNGCWEWMAAKSPIGYGYFYANKHNIRAHRWSYEYHKEKILEGLVIDHLCRNKSCVNPDHLEAVTNRENTIRGVSVFVSKMRAILRTHCNYGHLLIPENIKIRHKNGVRYRSCCLCAERWKITSRVNAIKRKNELNKI